MRLGGHENFEELVAIGAAIRARRRAQEISQEHLALLAGIDRSHMGKIERGERNVSVMNLIRICTALQTRASELLATADC
ncbi:helix-turn-helix domain-containing protein [Massilia consociata]|jgi:transcriptional regulator with XRE-family HTH domain|uniref:Helix-turn-helix domain-containing protein n=1 Tax=Massilia consociata TaxID=760117 RepID=A0ABV6FMH0_9BURK